MMHRRVTTALALLGVVLLLVSAAACSKNKAKPLVPLALEAGASPLALSLNEQGTQAYRARDFDAAKGYFSQTVTAAPQSGPAHYNYALALNALGETEAARKQFIEAANFAPGDKIIWDSPALSPYGNPETEEKKVAAPQNPNRRSGMGGR
ncbi:MAG: tetratricopeptide repeat protein [Nitrospira sp.]|jgi:Flp pilus assembly protein TadD|nr:tetratricopeptide repeat protein [Nitrospira sp.]